MTLVGKITITDAEGKERGLKSHTRPVDHAKLEAERAEQRNRQAEEALAHTRRQEEQAAELVRISGLLKLNEGRLAQATAELAAARARHAEAVVENASTDSQLEALWHDGEDARDRVRRLEAERVFLQNGYNGLTGGPLQSRLPNDPAGLAPSGSR